MSKVTFSLPISYDLFVGGDFCAAWDGQNAKLRLDSDLTKLMQSATLRCLNLECPISSHSQAIKKTGPALKASPSSVKLFKDLQIELCSLANNHILDYGFEGARDTISHLELAGIEHTGLSAQGEHPILVKEVNGRKVAFVSFTENEFSTIEANGLQAVPLDCYAQLRQMQQARQAADYVVVQYHGGVEQYPYPTPGQKNYARFMAELGATVVICHHSHCVSGYEIYNDVPIFYGLGNFYFPEAGNSAEWFQGLALCISLEPELKIAVAPILHELGSGVLRLNTSGSESVEASIIKLNECIGSDAALHSRWTEFCAGNVYSTLSQVFRQSRLLSALIRRGIIRSKLSRKLSLGFFNLVRCESHRERLLETMKQELEK